mmetsp:Transcript_16461/g.49716  ORF Transcript_16461/g.49716 Transcript_16461/m.49716 type:complete len:209 (-) Transcript_16461:1205-1831(-)
MPSCEHSSIASPRRPPAWWACRIGSASAQPTRPRPISRRRARSFCSQCARRTSPPWRRSHPASRTRAWPRRPPHAVSSRQRGRQQAWRATVLARPPGSRSDGAVRPFQPSRVECVARVGRTRARRSTTSSLRCSSCAPRTVPLARACSAKSTTPRGRSRTTGSLHRTTLTSPATSSLRRRTRACTPACCSAAAAASRWTLSTGWTDPW